MVLRDEKERKRLSIISRAVRSDTKCRIYKSELQPCNRDEACGVCLDCLDDFERFLTHDEQIEFKHCLVSAESRLFEKYQIEVAKIIRERKRDENLRIEALEEEKRVKKDTELQKIKQLEEEEKKMREAREREQQEKDKKALNDIVDAQIHEIKLKSTSFTNAELIEVVNYTPKGQKLLAEQKQRLEEQLESAKFVNIPISNTLSPKFRVTINSFENIPDLSNMKHICVTIKLISREGIVLESTECVPGVEFGKIVDNCLILNASGSFCSIPRRTCKCEKCGTVLKVTYNSDLRDKKFRCTKCDFKGEIPQEEYIWQSIKTWPPGSALFIELSHKVERVHTLFSNLTFSLSKRSESCKEVVEMDTRIVCWSYVEEEHISEGRFGLPLFRAPLDPKRRLFFLKHIADKKNLTDLKLQFEFVK